MFEIFKSDDYYELVDRETKYEIKLQVDDETAFQLVEEFNRLKIESLKQYYIGQFKILFELNNLYGTMVWDDLVRNIMDETLIRFYIDSRTPIKKARRRINALLHECWHEFNRLRDREDELY